MTYHEIAQAAHKVETDLLGQQCGIQDQIASAYGGINLIDMHEYPYASVHPIHLDDATWWELEGRLSLIYVGQPHSSSDIHKIVIAELQNADPACPKLQQLRTTARRSKNALSDGDFDALGQVMIENTRMQADLHPKLVGAAHQTVIEIAREYGAIGWKVNGAGGDGGSITILHGPDRARKRAMVRAIQQADPRFRSIPISLSRAGLRVWTC